MMADDSDFAYHPPGPSADDPVVRPSGFTIHRGTGMNEMRVGKAKTLQGASRAVDRHDKAYGASVHYHKPIYD